MTGRRARGQGGFVAGGDGMVIGVLVLVGGTVLALHLWGVVTLRADLDAAAREYLRTWSEADDPLRAVASARAAFDVALDREHPADLVLVEPDPRRFGPCEPATVVVSASVASLRMPGVGPIGRTTVRLSRTELVDPHRELRPGPAHDPAATPCGGGRG